MKWLTLLITIFLFAGIGYGEETPIVETEMPQEDTLERQLREETMRLEAMREELIALINAPLPQEVKAEPPAVEPAAADIPPAPLPGMEEEYANSLYTLGQIDTARAAYQKLIESNPAKETLTWAKMQLGNCDRRMGNFADAIVSYEAVVNTAAESLWAKEAAWWAGHLRWRLLWNETARSAP